MDKPMTFIDWCSSNGKIPYSLGLEGAYEAGQQSMQAKVEELQKRVDAVIIEIENMYLSGAIGFDTVKKLEQALKGEV